MLSGVDLFHKSWQLTQSLFPYPLADLTMEFREPIFHMPKLSLTESSTPDPRAQAWFRSSSQNGTILLNLLPGEIAPTQVYEFAEKELMQSLTVSKKSARFQGRLQVSPIQLLATASKVLMTRFSSNADLVLFRIELADYIFDQHIVEILVTAEHAGPRTSNRTWIERDGLPLGRLSWAIREDQ